MWGRVRLSSDVSEIKLVFSIPPHRPTPNIAPSWNVAPTDPLPVVRYDPKASERSVDVMRWGLVPFWAKHFKVGFSNINAMPETVDTKPAFREAFQRRRCLVPVDNFYEWAKTETGKLVRHARRAVLCLLPAREDRTCRIHWYQHPAQHVARGAYAKRRGTSAHDRTRRL